MIVALNFAELDYVAGRAYCECLGNDGDFYRAGINPFMNCESTGACRGFCCTNRANAWFLETSSGSPTSEKIIGYGSCNAAGDGEIKMQQMMFKWPAEKKCA